MNSLIPLNSSYVYVKYLCDFIIVINFKQNEKLQILGSTQRFPRWKGADHVAIIWNQDQFPQGD